MGSIPDYEDPGGITNPKYVGKTLEEVAGSRIRASADKTMHLLSRWCFDGEVYSR